MIDRDLLSAYLEDALDPEARAQVEAQLPQDPEALGFLAGQRKMDRLLRSALRPARAKQRGKQSILAAVRASAPEQLRARVLKATTVESVETTERPKLPAWTQIRRLALLTLQRFNDLTPGRSLAYGTLSVVVVMLSLGFWFYFQRAPIPRITVGQFTAVVGQPTVQSAGERITRHASRITPVYLGDRIETGDADKTEIQFHDGTTLRLNFNTSLEIPGSTVQRLNASSLQRPPEINLLRGQVWTKVHKTTNATPYAIRTHAATAVARGTEFGVRLLRPPAGPDSQSQIADRKSQIPLLAVLTVKEGAVDFFNGFGSVQATAMTESTARADAAPTEPKRLETLQVVRLDDAATWSLVTSPLDWPEAAERLAGGGGSVRWRLRDVPRADGGLEIRISQLPSSSPAARAGLRVGDALTALDDQTATNAHQVARAILLRPGAPVRLRARQAVGEEVVAVAISQEANVLRGPELPAGAVDQLTDLLRQWIATPSGHATNATVEARRFEEAARLSRSNDVRAAAFNNLGVVFELADALGPAIRAYGRAVYLEPQVPLYCFNLGLALRKIGSFERALEEFEQAARLEPESIPARKRVAEVRSLLGRHTEALDLTEALLKSAPQDHGAWELKAQLLLKLRRPAEAVAPARLAAELDPDCPVAHAYLAEAYHAAGKLSEAEAAWTEALDRAPFEAVFHMNLGTLQRDLGQSAAAEHSFRRAIELRPDFSLAHRNLGEALADGRDFAAASKEFGKAKELDPSDAAAHRRFGDIALKRRQFDQAEQAYRAALEASPNDPEATHGLGEVFRLRRKPAEAERFYRKAIELKPDYATAHTGLGIVFHERGDFVQAEKLYRKAIELDPKDSAPFNNLGNIYREARGNPDEAEKFYRKALELSPDDAEPRNGLGLVALDHGQLTDAERWLRQAREREPDSPIYLNNLGDLLRQRGRLDEAEALFRKALELDPDYLSPYGNLGIVYASRKSFAKAEQTFRALLERSRGNARLPALVNLASVCGEQGKLDEAESLFRQALALAPDHPRVGNNFASFLADHQLKLDEALALATRAVQTAPNDPNFLDTLGWVQAQRGELAAAERTLQRALDLAGQEPPAEEIREHLKQVQGKTIFDR